jgi:tRNA sulfurtransferase ThiI
MRVFSSKKGLVVAFGELFLKSDGVRKLLLQKLASDLTNKLKAASIVARLYKWHDRYFLETSEIVAAGKVLSTTFGISWYADAEFLPKVSREQLGLFVRATYPDWIPQGASYALDVRIADKDMDRHALIDEIAPTIKRPVNLTNPDVVLYFEARKEGWLVFTQKTSGMGGLPLASQGRVAVMMSGGLDSPVASWMVMKRGAENVWIHFHSFPLVSMRSVEKVRELAEAMSCYQSIIKVIEVPFGDIQLKIKAEAEPRYRVLLYRRAMVRIAEKIAMREWAMALVTGESLGQVASQTLTNLSIVDGAAKMPILRPLIGMDKQEIVAISRRIGTYEISIKPQEDCCSLFVPPKPTAEGKLHVVKEIEKKLKLGKMINKAVGYTMIKRAS